MTTRKATPRKRLPREPSSRPVGRPSHKPTAQSRILVRTLYIAGWSQEKIGPVVGCNDATLRVHYREELRTGKAQVDAMVTQTIVQMALGGKGDAEQPYDWRKAIPSMAAFYAKTRMGWAAPKQEVALSGGVGHYDMSKLTDDEVFRVTELLERAAIAAIDVVDGGGNEA